MFNVYADVFVYMCRLQARKVFDDGAESLPGLIPARHRQQQSVPLPNPLYLSCISVATYTYMYDIIASCGHAA